MRSIEWRYLQKGRHYHPLNGRGYSHVTVLKFCRFPWCNVSRGFVSESWATCSNGQPSSSCWAPLSVKSRLRGKFRPLTELIFLTDRQKFVTNDYASDPYANAKFGANPPGASVQIHCRWNI